MVEAVIFDWVGTLYHFGGKGLFPFSERVLETLKPRYKLAVISKADHDKIEERSRQIDEVKKYFEFIDVGADKTLIQFIRCMESLKVPSKKTLVVDDRTVRGIRLGNMLGCQTAWIQRGTYSNEIPNEKTGEPTYRINSVEDLLTIL